MSLKRLVVLGLCAGMSFTVQAQDGAVVGGQPAEAQAAPALKVGDAAPALKVAKWVKGKEVKGFEKDKVYVVEFWATWCGPCKKTIPHLTKLAKEMKDKATVIGVSVWETPPGETGTDYIAKVEGFVTKMGDKMDYTVAADTAEGDMAKSWMEASQQGGIPTAFVIGKDSKVAWIGHPMDGLDKVLAEVVAGTFSPERAAALKAESEKAQEEIQKAMERIQALQGEGKSAEAMAELDKMIASTKDEDMKINMNMQRFMMLSQSDETKAYAFAREIAGGPAGSNPQALYGISSYILEADTLKTPDYALAEELLTKTCELHRAENDNKDHPMLISSLAKAKFKKGDTAGAVATQENAVKLIEEMGAEVPPQFVDQFKATLEEYKNAKK